MTAIRWRQAINEEIEVVVPHFTSHLTLEGADRAYSMRVLC